MDNNSPGSHLHPCTDLGWYLFSMKLLMSMKMEKKKKTWRERTGPALTVVKGREASPADCRQVFELQVSSLLMGTQWQLCLLRKWKSLYWSTAQYVMYVTIFPVPPTPHPWRGPVEEQGMASWSHWEVPESGMEIPGACFKKGRHCLRSSLVRLFVF